MTELIEAGIIHQIALHHHNASLKAAEAIFHAREAGRLLIEAKQSVAHGDFTSWISANLSITPRQVQRYMRAAKLKDTAQVEKLEKKNSLKSPLVSKKTVKGKSTSWSPKPGYIYFAVWDSWSYIIKQNNNPDEFQIVVMYSVKDTLESSSSIHLNEGVDFKHVSVPIDQVESALQKIGISEPSKLWWTILKPEEYESKFADLHDPL